ncbi:MAG: ATP-binding protein [Candidatus Sumerlaeaceae bacterium]
MTRKTENAKDVGRRRRLRSAQLVSRIGQVFSSNKSLDTTLLAIVNLIRTTFDLDRCSVLLLHRDRGVLTLAAAAGIPEKFWPAIEIPIGEGISGRVVHERKPVLVEDISQSEFAHAAHHERYSTKSFVSVPILVSGEVVGVLNANSRADADPLGREELDILVAIAGFVGLGIANFQLSTRCDDIADLFKSVLDAVQCAVVIVDRSLVVRHVNAEASCWLQLSSETKVQGRSLLDLWPQLDGTETLGRLREVLAAAPRCALVESLSFPANIRADMEVFISPMNSKSGQPLALLAVRDISASAQVDSYKSQFLSLLAHELRTPFTAIQAASDMLLGTPTDSQCSDWAKLLHIVSSNSRRLLTVVNSLLDLHELERGALVLDKQLAHIEEVLADTVRLFESDAEKKKIRLKLSCVPITANVDVRRFSQIVSALVDNAIKYSPQAAVVEIAAQAQPDGTLEISIRDYGPGIPPQLVICETLRFQPGEPLVTRTSGGLGVGLYLARALAALHGGELIISSPEGGGTLAIVRLPLAKTVE